MTFFSHTNLNIRLPAAADALPSSTATKIIALNIYSIITYVAITIKLTHRRSKSKETQRSNVSNGFNSVHIPLLLIPVSFYYCSLSIFSVIITMKSELALN